MLCVAISGRQNLWPKPHGGMLFSQACGVKIALRDLTSARSGNQPIVRPSAIHRMERPEYFVTIGTKRLAELALESFVTLSCSQSTTLLPLDAPGSATLRSAVR